MNCWNEGYILLLAINLFNNNKIKLFYAKIENCIDGDGVYTDGWGGEFKKTPLITKVELFTIR